MCSTSLARTSVPGSAFKSATPAHDYEADVTSHWTVGPGAYNLSSFFQVNKLPASDNRSSFRSRRRPPPAQAPTPGPGAYSPSGWGVRSSNQSSRSSLGSDGSSSVQNGSFVWTRRATAPSIPSIDQAMGYEEDAEGQLVAQEAQRPPQGGVAPNHYSPQHTLTKPRAVVADFSAAAGREQLGLGTFQTGASADAPASYTGMTANPRPRRSVPSASFATKWGAAEGAWQPWPGGPGPAKYDGDVASAKIGSSRPIKRFPQQRRA